MPRRKVTEKEKDEIKTRVISEFPGSKTLQDIHNHRYIKELEWETMTNQEILADIKKGAKAVKEKMGRGKTKV
jgi:hypothetical protein